MSNRRRHNSIPHTNVKWDKTAMEPVMNDLKSGMKRREVAEKYGMNEVFLGTKITQYNYGELK